MTDFRFSGLLWTPAGTRAEKRTHRCRICNTDLHAGEYEAHVVKCARRNEDVTLGESPRHLSPEWLGREGMDTEWFFWHRERHGVR